MPAGLSAVVVTKNEEKQIRRCLDSVKWADEIVVVDGFSTDRTVEICREYGAKIIQHRHQGDYYGVGEEERNIGIDNSTGDWILQLDADEIVTSGLRRDIENILQKWGQSTAGTVPIFAYRFRRKNFFLGHPMRYGGWYHYSLHFFKRGKARYRGNIHEELVVDGPIGRLEGEVEHYPFTSMSQFIRRHNDYSNREAQQILKTNGVLPKKEILYHLKRKPLKLFWKFYIKKAGFLEGFYGLLFSALFAWVHFINWAKYWELVKDVKGSDY